jgi:hypothetical protein
VVDPGYKWEWKDNDDYQRGIEAGGIAPEWVTGIEQALPEVFNRIEGRQYPLDGSWVGWRPDTAWQPPRLPADWDRV